MSTSIGTLLSALGRLSAKGGHAILGLKTAWERRRVVGQLAALDDHMLQDIGVTRHDVLSVLAEPLYRDPSECLAARAAETRRHRRATVIFHDDARAKVADAWVEAPSDHRRVA